MRLLYFMKKLLFIANTMGGGGAEKALLTLLRNLDYHRFQVDLCLVFREGIYLSELPEQVRLLSLFSRPNSWYRKVKRWYIRHGFTHPLAWCIRRKIDREYDTIISFLEGDALLFHAQVTDRARFNLSWIHCDLYHYHYTSCFFASQADEAACYRKMNKLVFVTEEARKNFYRRFPIDIPSQVVYNLVDQDEICRQAGTCSHNTSGCLLITAIGSLLPVKGFDRLIRVTARLHEAGLPVRLQLLGEGPESESLHQLTRQAGAESYITFCGFQRNVYTYLRQSDLFVSSSHSEGFSLVICEAMALGVPVVATTTAGSVELLADGAYGLLAGQDEDGLYEAMYRLLSDETLRLDYAAKAASRAGQLDKKHTLYTIYKLLESE